MKTNGFAHEARKIDPTKVRPDGTPDNDDRVEIGPTPAAFALWAQRGLQPPNVPRMRKFRLNKLLEEMKRRDLPAMLMYDPVNLRYALDATHVAIWSMHAPSRAALVTADGYAALWDFIRCGHVVAHIDALDEIRDDGSGCLNYFMAGDNIGNMAQGFAAQIDALMREHCGSERRIGVDLLPVEVSGQFASYGFEIIPGQEVFEHARLVKGEDEIRAMRCAIAACEESVRHMEHALVPGIAESELWSVMQKQNIAFGGEWIETRLLASGPRTNPWMQECGPRIIQDGEIVAFDTDMVGTYGFCCDISRTWLCGDGTPTQEQKDLYKAAYDMIAYNTEIIRPGMTFVELMESARQAPPQYRAQRYAVLYHGIGLVDEFPAIKAPEDYTPGEYDYPLQPGMTLCVESYVGEVGGREGVKLEDQVLVTETGVENLTSYPFDDRLLG